MLRKIIAAAVLLAALSSAGVMLAIDAQNAQKLQQGIDLLESKNDLVRAMDLFEQASHSSDHGVAARALLYIGQIQERQGKNNAQATYQKIIDQFGKLQEASEARKRLVALGVTPSNDFSLHRISAVKLDVNSIGSDGRLIAGIDWNTTDGDVAVQDTITGAITTLKTRSDGPGGLDEYGEWAALSPDQSKVMFFWDPNQKDLDYQLRVMDRESSGKFRVLFQLNDEITWIDNAVWFPDNKSVLVQMVNKNDEWKFVRLRTDVEGKPVPVDIKSMQWRLQGVRGNPSISPDGKYIAYAALASNPVRSPRETRAANNRVLPENKDQYIYVLPADGSGAETPVARSSGINESPFWTPDGHILFVSDRPTSGRSGSWGLWSVEIANGKPVSAPSPVKPEIGRIRPLGVNRSGSYYFTQGLSGVDIFTAQLKPGTAKPKLGRFTEYATDANLAPSWSPDGKRVAFLRNQILSNPLLNGPQRQQFELVIHSMDSGEERPIPIGSNRPSPFPPVWFHKSDALLLSIVNGLVRVNLKSGDVRTIESVIHLSLPTGVDKAALSPDDQILYLSTREATRDEKLNRTKWRIGIVSFNMTTGEQKNLYSADSPSGFIDLALDSAGKNIAVIAQPEGSKNARLLRLLTSGGTPLDLGAAATMKSSLQWSVDNSRILYRTDETAKESPLAWIPANGGKPEYLNLDVNGFSISTIALNPVDESRILISGDTASEELWRMDNLASLWGGSR